MDMDVIKQVSWLSTDYTQGPVKGVVLSFHGLGMTSIKGGPGTEELGWAQAGGLVVFPYYGPWSWMNRQARGFVDQLVDSIYKEFSLPPGAPLICTGGSMGGCSSLLYTRYAKRPVRACLANCPVCDVKFHFSERPDLPMSMRYAFDCYSKDMDAVFTENSPLSQVAAMPDISYLIFHGGKDTAVAKKHHSDPMVAAMRNRNLKVDYVEVPLMGHCGPMPVDLIQKEVDFVRTMLG